MGLWFLSIQASAEPYIPANDSMVLAEVPVAEEIRRLEPLRSQAAASKHPRYANQLAKAYIGLARTHGDPRYLGYAEAVLSPWLAQPRPPVDSLVLIATISQSRHEFGNALLYLDRVLEIDPDDAQALLTRATVLQVTGEFGAATQACQQLQKVLPGIVSTTCLASAKSMNGSLPESYSLLEMMITTSAETDARVKSWSLTQLGEMSVRMGQPDTARQHFESALALTPQNSYLLAVYSDLLIELGNYDAVLDLLQGKEQQDILLLRLALAGKVVDAPRTEEWTNELKMRFDAARLREGGGHYREEARLYLQLLNQPRKALELAALNWQQQHEPADVLLLLQAASHSGDQAILRSAFTWVDRHGYQDQRISRFRP